MRARHRLLPIGEAIQQVHFPSPNTDLAALDHGVTDAHRRLARKSSFSRRLRWRFASGVEGRTKGVPIPTPGGIFDFAWLPLFTLTAQERVAGDPVGYDDVQADESSWCRRRRVGKDRCPPCVGDGVRLRLSGRRSWYHGNSGGTALPDAQTVPWSLLASTQLLLTSRGQHRPAAPC